MNEEVPPILKEEGFVLEDGTPVIMGKEEVEGLESKNYYDRFIRQALMHGFTDEQADFIWDNILTAIEYPDSFTNKDNYPPIREVK